MDIKIREWNHTDAKDIASVQVSSWQSTYRGIISADYLDDLNDPEKLLQRIEKWSNILNDPDQRVFVALDTEKIIWFATCGKSTELEWYESCISSIYLLNEYQWNGIWSNLFRTCIHHLQSLGYQSMYIWVLADNPAKNFYEKMWGEYKKEIDALIGKETYKEYLYYWQI